MLAQVNGFRNKHKDIMYTVFRAVFGVLFMMHGLQKFGVLGGTFAMPGKTLMLVAGIVEVVGGLLIALGLFTSIAAFIAAGQMAVAYFMSHAPSVWWNTLANKGEPAVLFCFAFLLVWFFGPGKYSLDEKLCPTKGKK
jgi:putative oxidoreductase